MTSERRANLLFTAERLFGEVATAGLSRHAIFLERAKAETGRDETAVHLALTAYLVVRLVDTYLLVDRHDSTDREGFLWQHNAVRRHMDELPTDIPETSHLSGIIDAVPLDGEPNSTLRISLTAYAYFLEHEARLEEALEILALATRAHGLEIPAGDFAACALFAGRLSRLLARWDRAIACYEAAAEAATSIGDAASVFKSRLGRSAIYRGQGNLPLARKFAEEVIQHAGDLQLFDLQASGYADLYAVLSLQGHRVEALEAGYRAFLMTSDPLRRMQTLGNLGIGLHEIGAHGVARLAFNIVVDSKASFYVRINALLELMDLESSVGNRVAFERSRTLLDTNRERMAPSTVTDYLYKVAIGLARFGQTARARETMSGALDVAETHQLNTWYFRIEAALKNLETRLEQDVEVRQVAESDEVPIVREMHDGLRRYAELQLA